MIETVDPNMTLRSLIGVRPYRRRGAQAGHEAEAVAQDSKSETSKSGKEVALALVRGSRIPLSSDSQGRDLSLIPPGSDGFSSLNKLNSLSEFSMQGMVDKVNTLPQHSTAKEAWNQVGPEFQRCQTRFRTYGNTFDAGFVLPDYIGPR